MLVALSNHVIGDPTRMGLHQQESPMSPAIVSPARFKHSLEFDIIAMSSRDRGGRRSRSAARRYCRIASRCREDECSRASLIAGRQRDGALLVAGVDQAEEQVRLLAVQEPKAHLVDDQERAVEITLRLEPAGWGGITASSLSTCIRSSSTK